MMFHYVVDYQPYPKTYIYNNAFITLQLQGIHMYNYYYNGAQYHYQYDYIYRALPNEN